MSTAALADTTWWKTFALEPRDRQLLGCSRRSRQSGMGARDGAGELGTDGGAARRREQPRPPFRRQRRLQRRQTPDRARVGIYDDKQGKRGSVVAVFTRRDDHGWQAVYSEVGDDPDQFSVLHQSADEPYRVSWSQCLDCGAPVAVTWSGINFFLEYLHEPRRN
ncbi:MAG TPA: hypothetical protein VLF18_07405 [Tahibacter sp.]|uniref:hypothetical protein n=1 Tax=Tahibacter sp. TaxID=2056211 RepID=UPI002CC42F17|nr:hypothetical protein [Tahibacter sp.]HSX60007.1 hypothetical protein [Tahibacter sp.]